MQPEFLSLFIEKMKKAGLPGPAIDTFTSYYTQLKTGKTGLIFEDEITPLKNGEIDNLSDLTDYEVFGKKALQKTVIIKLNGGLGTTMGLQGPKSIIPVKNGLSFLDITASQILDLNKIHGFRIPLIFMNSFRTETESCKALEKYPELRTEIPLSFIQNKFPRILVSNLDPVDFPKNPNLEWNPPGHGDLYTSLLTSGILDKIIEMGYQYAFISNIDNLGANLDTNILGYFAEKKLSFLMEVTERTPMDRKGGHLARQKNGRFVLRESAQCPKENLSEFSDITRHRLFNTNNLWIDLNALRKLLTRSSCVLGLPMICNIKKLDPIISDSPEVYQLESAMGSAISVFDSASALEVPRTRFAPVKNCEELLLLWSDYYLLTNDYRIVRNPERKSTRLGITLDPEFYSRIDQLESRFTDGTPSLLNCDALKINGDVKFGKNVVITGNITINNKSNHQKLIPDNQVITQDLQL